MTEIERAIWLYEDAARCPCDTYAQLILKTLRRECLKPPKPDKRIPGIGKCQICKTELCIDDPDLFFCPTCGQRLKEGTYNYLSKEAT